MTKPGSAIEVPAARTLSVGTVKVGASLTASRFTVVSVTACLPPSACAKSETVVRM